FGPGSAIHYNFAEHCLSEDVNDEAFHGAREAKHLPCFSSNSMHAYMMRKDVQVALHVSNRTENSVVSWEEMNRLISTQYDRSYDVVSLVYKDILRVAKSPFRMLAYHGDTDILLSPMSTVYNTRKIAEESNLTETQQETSWHFFGDYAGARTSFKSDVTNVTMDVLTVRGAGHSVPYDLPAQACQMINNFLFTDDSKLIDYSQPIRKH
ncbi:hypothetical protein PFISCL1PPCAC_5156, partial [Pristionchus fissidentatus]